jgi:REP element-mobilizing transposase RayT
MSTLAYKYFYRRNLPHIQPEGAILFITYRLAFNFSHEIKMKMLQKVNEINKKSKTNVKVKDKLYFKYYDEVLTKINNYPDWLNNQEVAKIIIDNLLYHHKDRYELICVLIMPNHVHTILRPLHQKNGIYFSLQSIMKYHKSYTAIKVNRVLKRKGQFWHHESYDHFIRDEGEFYRIIEYILNNPVKAGLIRDYRDWPYKWLNKNYVNL